MADEQGTATQTEESTETTTEVKNPDAVLKKNQELLGKLAAEKKEREALTARVAEFEAKEAELEQKRLEKRGEWEKLRESMEASHKDAISKADQRYSSLFANAAKYELAVAIGKLDVFDGEEENLADLLLLKNIKPVEKDGKVEWRSIKDDTTVDLHEYLPTLKTAYGVFFKADNNPGGDAPGNTGKTVSASAKWSKMTTAERNEAIRAAGGDVAAAKKKHS